MGFSIPNPLDVGREVVDRTTDLGGAVVNRVTDVGETVVDRVGDVVSNPTVQGGVLGGLALGPAGVVPGMIVGNAAGRQSTPQHIMGPGGCVPVPPQRPSFWQRIMDMVREVRARSLSTSDQALDNAASNLDGFREYMGLYNEYTGASLTFEGDIQQPYDQLRGIDFARLSEVAAQCAEVAGQFGETMQQLSSDVNEHTSQWTGDAADSFVAHTTRFGHASQQIDDELGKVAEATSESVTSAQRVVIEYVDVLRGIDFSGFDSKELISLLIRVSRMEFSAGALAEKLFDGLGDVLNIALPALGGGGGLIGWVSDRLNDLVSAFGKVLGTVLDAFGFGSNVSGFVSWVAGLARNYLDASFRQPFETNLELFRDATQTAVESVSEAFQPMVAASNAVGTVDFGSVGQEMIDDPNAQNPDDDGGGDDEGDDGKGEQPESENTDTGSSDDRGGDGTTPGTGSGSSPGSGGGMPPGLGDPVVPPEMPDAEPPTDDGQLPDDGADGGMGAGRPDGLPPGGGWVPDPSQVPPGWTMDPITGELMPPDHTPDPDGSLERPEGLPPGGGWIADPSQLPEGWTVDPANAQLFPPGSPEGAGFPEVHSPEGQAALQGDGGAGGGGGAGEIVVDDGRMIICGPAGDGENPILKLTDADGNVTEYEIRVGENGEPELVPVESSDGQPVVETLPGLPDGMTLEEFDALSPGEQQQLAAATFTEPQPMPAGSGGGIGGGPGGSFGGGPAFAGGAFGGGVDAGAPGAAFEDGPAAVPGTEPAATAPAAQAFGPAGGGSALGAVPSAAGGEVSGGGAGATSGGGQVAGGHVGAGSAQLASASDSASGSMTGQPGSAQLASAGDPGQGSAPSSGSGSVGGGGGMMPMGAGMGTPGAGEEQRSGGGNWQVPGEAIFEPGQDAASRIQDVLGEGNR